METILNRGTENETDDGHELTSSGLRRRGCTSDDILRLLVYSPLENKSFVPNGALEELITFETITSTLATAGLPDRELICLANVIVEKGRRIFAILVFINQLNEIGTFFNEGFTDDMLPVAYQAEGDSWKVRSYIPNSDDLDREKVWVFFQHWKKSTIFSFCERQWMFLSPVFSKEQFKYFLHRDAILPFVSAKGQTKQSYYSMVFHVEVHAAHQRFETTINRPLDCAIKELAAPDSENTFEKESDALACMRKIDHKHLIKCIAAVKKEQRYFFVFPWADGGNLREFWASDNFASPNIQTVSWAISQMQGLSNALAELHNCNTRHGDLKPENILRFSDDTSPGHGRLVIADVGLAKVHTNTTRSRHFPTRTVTGTARYEAPEAFVPHQSRSRVYDVWSLGCILLEFIIWVLHGGKFLQRFNSLFESYAKTTENGVPQLDLAAKRVIELMFRDPRCARNTALGEILDFTKRRLLVPIQGEGNVPSRASAKELYGHLSMISDKGSDNSTYLFNAEIWDTFGRSSLSSHRLSASLLLPANLKGLELPVQIKQNRRVPLLTQLAPMAGSTGILGENLTEEPAPIRIDRYATPKPREEYPAPVIDPSTPVANGKGPQQDFSLDLQKHPPAFHMEAEANDKSARSTLYSSSDSGWSAASSYNCGSISSISEGAMEGISQDDRVFESIVKNKKEYIANKTLAWFSRTLDSGLTLAAYQHGETSASGGYTPGNGKLTGDGSGKSSGQKKRKGVGDGEKDEDPDDEDGDEDDDRKRMGKKKPRTNVNNNQKFACPFFKRNPELYGKNMTCRGHSWDTVHRTKEHLYRVHMQPEGRCHRCLVVFKNISSLQQHQRKPVPCNVVESNGDEAYIDAETAQKLRRQPAKRAQPRKTESVKWKEMFSLLFPNFEPIPSPYYDTTQEKRSELEVIQDFSSFVAREFRPELDAILAEFDIEEALKARLVERFHSSQPKIQKKYLQRQGRCCSSDSEQEAESPVESAAAPDPEQRSHRTGPRSESGKEDDTRNEGGGLITDSPMNHGFLNGNEHAVPWLGDERLISNLLTNSNPTLFASESSPYQYAINMSNFTAPANLQSTGSYQASRPSGSNNITPNMRDSLTNSLNTSSLAQDTYTSFGTSPNTNQSVFNWGNSGRQNLGSHLQDPQLTPVASTPTGRRISESATPSYAFWSQPSPVGTAGQLQNTPFDPHLGIGETGNRPRTVHPSHSQQPAFSSYDQPSHNQNMNLESYDSGYISHFSTGHPTVRDREEAPWDRRTEGYEK
ncbi:hypothetical protein F5Y10DRAFT_254264 [Nemania abortiva]|nr:hypothetical protein F5Y10DRAFT_254264 [Nemania abortiva]